MNILFYGLWTTFLALFGAALGSFVGALNWRLRETEIAKTASERKESAKLWHKFWHGGRSVCENCGHSLGALDLFPIFSWLFLRGKCRYCGAKIGVSALLYEVVGAFLFAASFLLWPISHGAIFGADFSVNWLIFARFLLWLVALVLMEALLFYDARFRKLPNKLMFPLIFVMLAFALFGFDFANFWSSLLSVVLALGPVFGIYLILFLINDNWVGLGDVRFGIVVALAVADWRLALFVLFLANVSGSIFALPSLFAKKVTVNSQIAFGPFLIFATILTVLFARWIGYFL